MANKLLVVVGVGPGIGTSVCNRFAAQGYNVAMMARKAGSLSNIEAQLRQQHATSKFLSVEADASDETSLRRAFDQVHQQLGPADVLVYNAGTRFLRKGILEINPDEFDKSWRVNCFGALVASQQVLPAMVQRKSGAILFTGATASLRGGSKFSSLSVGKFGLRSLAQSMAREFSPQGIHVAHVIIDGRVDSPALEAAEPETPKDSFLSPDAIAETYWQLVQQDRTAWTFELDLRPNVEKW